MNRIQLPIWRARVVLNYGRMSYEGGETARDRAVTLRNTSKTNTYHIHTRKMMNHDTLPFSSIETTHTLALAL